MNEATINNRILWCFLLECPQFLHDVTAVEVGGRRELILPAAALPALGDWAVAHKLIDRADVLEVLATLPSESVPKK